MTTAVSYQTGCIDFLVRIGPFFHKFILRFIVAFPMTGFSPIKVSRPLGTPVLSVLQYH